VEETVRWPPAPINDDNDDNFLESELIFDMPNEDPANGLLHSVSRVQAYVPLGF
jgi:hypothetical protein